MGYPTQEKVKRIRELYPIGCRVELVQMGADPYSKLKPGEQGIVNHIDDIGTIFVSWNCGSGLGMVYGVDHIRRLDTPVQNEASALSYMGVQVAPNALHSQAELMELLQSYGPFGQTLDKVRTKYLEQFGQDLIWTYPFSDDMTGGSMIIPVREGFLHIPYRSVVKQLGAQLDLDGAELLSLDAVHTLQTECEAYTSGLLQALKDMEQALQGQPPQASTGL